jgi:hypothetical protein
MDESRELILNMIKERSVLKQDVYACTKSVFEDLKVTLKEVVEEIKERFGETDSRVEFYFKEKGEYEAEVKIAGDVLVFYMHTNVFQFDKSHSVWQSSYLRDNELNGYVGVINIYNFLADSLKYQRYNDFGYMIGRLFVNKDNHFMVQGKRQLGYLYNDFMNATITKEQLKSIVESAIIYTLGFDLYTPPYQAVQEVTLGEIEAANMHLRMATGKRLGFKFSFDDEIGD